MRCFIIIACFVAFFGINSCSFKEKGHQIPVQSAKYIEENRETQVKVFVNPEEIPQGRSPGSLLSEKAEKKGMKKIMNHWIEKGYLFQCSNQTVYDNDKSDLLIHDGEFEPKKDKMTNIFFQEFDIKVSFVPVKQLAGKILELKSNRTFAGQGEPVINYLFEITPDDSGAYFLVARTEHLDDINYFKVIGSGKIYHTTDQIGQGIFLETYQEIMQKDYIFMLLVEIRPLKNTAQKGVEKTKQSSMGSEVEEVIVEPKQEKTLKKKIKKNRDIQVQGKGT